MKRLITFTFTLAICLTCLAQEFELPIKFSADTRNIASVSPGIESEDLTSPFTISFDGTHLSVIKGNGGIYDEREIGHYEIEKEFKGRTAIHYILETKGKTGLTEYIVISRIFRSNYFSTSINYPVIGNGIPTGYISYMGTEDY